MESQMEKAKEFGKAGFRNLAMAMSFGAYHLYVMDEKWKLHQEIRSLQDKRTDEILKKIEEYNAKRWW